MKRTFSAAITICGCAAQALAQDGFLGTKASPISAAGPSGSAGAGFGSIMQMLIALGIVLGLIKWVMPKIVGRMNKRFVTSVTSSIRIEESAAFAGGSLYVVQAKSKTLLLSVSTAGVACLADLTDKAPEPAPPTFAEMVHEAVVRTDEPLPSETRTGDGRPEVNDIEAALKRLQQLAR